MIANHLDTAELARKVHPFSFSQVQDRFLFGPRYVACHAYLIVKTQRTSAKHYINTNPVDVLLLLKDTEYLALEEPLCT